MKLNAHVVRVMAEPDTHLMSSITCPPHSPPTPPTLTQGPSPSLSHLEVVVDSLIDENE